MKVHFQSKTGLFILAEWKTDEPAVCLWNWARLVGFLP